MNSNRTQQPVNREPKAGSDAPPPLFGGEGPPTSDRQPETKGGGGPEKPPEPPAAPPSAEPTPDPFDPARLRLSQDFASSVGVRKLLTKVHVGKPSKEWWFRTHPNPDYWLDTALIELKEDRESYLVAPDLWPRLEREPTFSPRRLATGINRQGVLFLWPLRLPGRDGKLDDWGRSAIEGASNARAVWTRIYADMALGANRVEDAPGFRDEPDWPQLPLSEILRVAFRDKFISEWVHPVLRRLRGEA